jgi:hypothetical protein
MRVTCNASYYEDNSDSVELWVPGSPLFPMEGCKALAIERATERATFEDAVKVLCTHSGVATADRELRLC